VKYIILFLGVISLTANAQKAMPIFLGINPSVTVEPYYNKGELDVGVLPLVFSTSLSHRLDVRLSTILNLGIRQTENEISHYGFEVALPVFFLKKAEMKLPSQGFFLAPGIALTKNRLENHSNLSFLLEPGYHLLVTKRFALSFGLQLGATHFNYGDKPDKWSNHFGVKVIAGWWL
jgi:hypothetical protein